MYIIISGKYDPNDSSVNFVAEDNSMKQIGVVTLCVKDTGAGLSEENLKVSFIIFFPLNNNRDITSSGFIVLGVV